MVRLESITLFKVYIPIKMKYFFEAEISIYSRAEFFIYMFEDFLQRFLLRTVSVDFFSKMLEDFSTKHIKGRYLHEINEKFRAGINGFFCIKKILHFNGNGYFCVKKYFILMGMYTFNKNYRL